MYMYVLKKIWGTAAQHPSLTKMGMFDQNGNGLKQMPAC